MNTPRSTTSRGQVHPAVALLLGVAAVVGLVAAVVFAPRPSGASTSPTPTPTDRPSAAPSGAPSAAPSAGPISIDLQEATGHNVALVIDDQSGNLVDAVSGTPGDGMSVRWNSAVIENIDHRTIRVTWAGLPLDDTVALAIASEAGGYDLHLVQAAPYPNTDAMGADRVLVLTFDAPVSADDVAVTFERRVDS